MSVRHTVQVRDAVIDDVPLIVDFNCRLALESENKVLDPGVLTLGVEQALAQPAYCRYFIAEVDGNRVGQTMITYEWSDWRNGVLWWIQSVYVEPAYRGGGVFRALHEFIVARAHAQQNVCGLRLYVDDHNTAAQATYQRLGLAPSGHHVYECDWSGRVTSAE